MRLIDADKLINNISCSDDVALGVIEAFIDLQPTAYDVDKVVDELESAVYPYCICDIDGWEIDEDLLKVDMVEDIVRRGGMDGQT